MKSIFNVLAFMLIAVLICQCEKEEPHVKITDNNFLKALIGLGIDTDGDGQISNAEAEAVISLDVSSDSISDMTGIEKFVSLETLECDNNQLITLDVSNLTDLKVLWCNVNQMTSLDLSNNSNIGQDLLDLTYYFSGCYLAIGDMPTLEEVCVWTMPFPQEGFKLCADGSPNVYFTTDCSK